MGWAAPSRRWQRWSGHALWTLWALLAAAGLSACSARPLQADCALDARRELLATSDQIGGPYPVRFFALGDWGSTKSGGQATVAQAMNTYAQSFRPEFIISTGDNFYPHGLTSSADPQFNSTWGNSYRASGLQVPWWAVLGNHDYGDGCTKSCANSPNFQLFGALPASDPRWHAVRSSAKSAAGGGLALIFLDTAPLISSYRKTAWASLPGGISSQSPDSVLSQLDAALGAAAGADWRIVVGHHPPRSSGLHGNQADIISGVEPLLLKHNVQVYISGHDHDMEHIAVPPSPTGERYDIFVTGAGQATRVFRSPVPGSLFRTTDIGFAAVEVTAAGVTVDYRTEAGSVYKATVGPRT